MANYTNTRWLLSLAVALTPWALVGCGSKPSEHVQNQAQAAAQPKGQVAPVAEVPLLPVAAPKDESPPAEKEAQPPPERKDDEPQKKAALEDEYRALKRATELGWEVDGIDKNLRHTRIALGVLRDEKDLELLLKFPALKWLRVDVRVNGKPHYNVLSDEAFRTLGKLKTLESLDASGQVVTDKAAEELSKLDRLQYLNLDSARLSDSSLAIIGKIPNLVHLYLDNTTRYSPHKLTGLTGLKSLRTLSLKDAPYEPGGYIFLRDMASLTSLSIGPHVYPDKEPLLNDEEVAAIGQITALKHFKCDFVTERKIEKVA